MLDSPKYQASSSGLTGHQICTRCMIVHSKQCCLQLRASIWIFPVAKTLTGNLWQVLWRPAQKSWQQLEGETAWRLWKRRQGSSLGPSCLAL